MFTILDYTLLGLAYLLGSVPFGIFVARIISGVDITKNGSGNIGATNVVRTAGKRAGAITFVLDVLKGVVPVLIAREFAQQEMVVWFCAALAVLGHVFPVWLKFKGGKGVATTFAVVTSLYPPIGLISMAVWLLAFLTLRISSLSAILAMIAMPSAAFYYVDIVGFPVVYVCLFLAALVVARHHSNIRRLLRGEEKPFGKKR